MQEWFAFYKNGTVYCFAREVGAKYDVIGHNDLFFAFRGNEGIPALFIETDFTRFCEFVVDYVSEHELSLQFYRDDENMAYSFWKHVANIALNKLKMPKTA